MVICLSGILQVCDKSENSPHIFEPTIHERYLIVQKSGLRFR